MFHVFIMDQHFPIKGEFKIKLNRFNLDSSNENVANQIYWASTIGHEMLHNFGHKYRDNDDRNNWQINVFEIVLFLMPIIYLNQKLTHFYFQNNQNLIEHINFLLETVPISSISSSMNDRFSY